MDNIHLCIMDVIRVAMVLAGSCSAAQIVTVVDSRLVEKNPYLERILTPEAPDMKVVLSHENNMVATFDSVCREVSAGATILVDMSSIKVGSLLRSFARDNGILFITVKDESLVDPADHSDPFFLNVQPPGSSMVAVVQHIVQFDNLTKVAILYDESFDVHEIPGRLIGGVASHHLYQPINASEGGIRAQLERLRGIDIDNIVVIGSSSSVNQVLAAANPVTLLRDGINWFSVTKDERVTCPGCRLKVKVVVADGKFNFTTMNEYIEHMDQFDPLFIKVDEAFAYDLVKMLQTVLPVNLISRNVSSCNDSSSTTTAIARQAQDIVMKFKTIHHSGVFGMFSYEDGALRQQMTLNLRKEVFQGGTYISEEMLGTWTMAGGLNVSKDSLINDRHRRLYKVVVTPEYPPFIYRRVVTSGGNESRIQYSGLCIDLLEKIAEVANFDYHLYESPDSLIGALNKNGTWNGVINELIKEEADLAVGPISVMSERDSVIDFTSPWHEPVGLTILMRRAKVEYSLHRFLSVLELKVWGVIFASYFVFSVLMWLFDRYSPYSYQNNPGHKTERQTKRVFTLKEGIWFCMTSLTPQGGGEAPQALSGRLVAATWWLYGFLLIAFYTANLAAFLTSTRLETTISSLDDLTKQRTVKYGPLRGTSAQVYFERMANIEDKFYEIWKDMSLNDSLDPVQRAQLAVWDYPVSEKFTKLRESMIVLNSSTSALQGVIRGDIAFIDDATSNKFEALTNCEVKSIGEEFSRKPFAFAVAQGSPLRAEISNAILDLSNDRVLETLSAKWWHENLDNSECPTTEIEADGVSIDHVKGIFLVIAVGTGLAFIALAVETYFYRYKPRRDAMLYNVNKRRNLQIPCTSNTSSAKGAKTVNGRSSKTATRQSALNNGGCGSGGRSSESVFSFERVVTEDEQANSVAATENGLQNRGFCASEKL